MIVQSVLYISYDGMLEPLGKSQVLAYLRHLSGDRKIHLISFEKAQYWSDFAERKRLECDIADMGIVWHPLRYHGMCFVAQLLAYGWCLGMTYVLCMQGVMCHQ